MRLIRRIVGAAAAAALLAIAMLGLGASPVTFGPFGPGTPLGGAAIVQAASPAPSADVGGDTRSSGQGPGLVGAPGLAILGVLGLGLLTVVATTLYVRLSGGRRPSG